MSPLPCSAGGSDGDTGGDGSDYGDYGEYDPGGDGSDNEDGKSVNPANNVPSINFRQSSDAEILLLSTDWAYKSARNMQKRACNVYVFRLSFHFAYHRFWLGKGCLRNS